jgi:GNAT superfamily N-acetyltransferase
MSRDQDMTIVMTWSGESRISKCPDPDEYVYETSGDILGIDDNGVKQPVGKFQVYYVDAEHAIDEGEAIFDVLDAHSSHVAEYFEPVFGSQEPHFNSRILELFDHAVFGGNLLILDRLEVLPQYRGQGIGLTVLRHMIARFSSGAALVAMKPFPLQFEASPSVGFGDKWQDKMGLSQFPAAEDAATEKLFRYYSKLGFLRLSGTPMMVISTAHSLPSLEDM